MAKTVCIIGAGPAGLVAAKTLLHNAPRGRDSFKVTIYEAQNRVGGLWPTRRDDRNPAGVAPAMVANQSKHTMQFSDFAWDESDPDLPQAWQVGQYLERYAERYGIRDILFNHRVEKTELLADQWEVTAVSTADKTERKARFDHLLVAAGFFGPPIVDQNLVPTDLPWVHSSAYRDLAQLLDEHTEKEDGGRILVIGGQMSGVEVAASIASHISSEVYSPTASFLRNPEKFKVHHIIQRPIWTFPLFTSPKPGEVAPPFLPLDFASYNLNNRDRPLNNTQGHIPEEAAKITHGIFEAVVGSNQSQYHADQRVTEKTRSEPAYLAVSDTYLEHARAGLIDISTGKVQGPVAQSTVVSPSGQQVQDVVAAVLATGYEASPRLDFLPPAVLQTLEYAPSSVHLPIALSFHGTHHPDVPNLGFVGFYRSPYWGVMEMQARFLASFWTPGEIQQSLPRDSVDQILALRSDPRVSQFPMGDYPWLMQEIATALGMEILPTPGPPTPELPHNNKPMDILTPARYMSFGADAASKTETQKALEQTNQTALAGLTGTKYVARAVFRSLLGSWNLRRDITSRSVHQPSGRFVGKATFNVRRGTTDGLQCVGQDGQMVNIDANGMEYLYIENGTFVADNGLQFTATRRYVWRYNEDTDSLSVWFVKPEDPKRVDYLFHELKFSRPTAEDTGKGWLATAGHLCEEDYYGVKYEFRFKAINITQWSLEYSVNGPKKDYTLKGTYTR